MILSKPAIVSRWRRKSRGGSVQAGPLRSELLGREGLLQRAEELSDSQQLLMVRRGRSKLRRRLIDNFNRIHQAYRLFSQAAEQKELLPAGAQWILDNFHIISQQFRGLKRDLPRRYLSELPVVRNEQGELVPRVYDLACALISHTDSAVDPQLLAAAISTYQRRSPLGIGELWAFPIALRLALLENLRRLIDQIGSLYQLRRKTEELISQHELTDKGSAAESSLAIIQALAADPEGLPQVAAVLLRKLRARGPELFVALQWLEEKLRELQLDPDTLQRGEEHGQAADLVSIGNVITSLSTIEAWDWKQWFEQVSEVHRILSADPCRVYGASTFETRDACRRTVEALARRCRKSEDEIARSVVALASTAPSAALQAQVSYYLIGAGIPEFERSLDAPLRLKEALWRILRPRAFALYLVSLVLTTGTGLYALWLTALTSFGDKLTAALLVAAAVPFVVEFATSVVQYLAAKLVSPKPLPRLNFEAAIPPDAATTVVVHGIAFDRETVQQAVEGLEIRYLGNQHEALSFGLLLDLADAEQQHQPSDSAIFDFARDCIEQLNMRHSRDGRRRFFVMMRSRVWSESEQRFICWERKRGKLVEFNHWLRGGGDTSFSYVHADWHRLRGTVYIITLDLDTQLPPGTAWKLIGTIAHPLNHPELNPDRRVVTSGYGVVQPRIETDWRSIRASTFAELFCGAGGLDPYARLISNVYHDCFGEASYVGKGIYHARAFDEAMRDRVPSESLLSHDLFEGLHARVAFASDIEIFDGFPSRVHSFARREHRWVRGDWQLLPWLGRTVPMADGRRGRSPLSLLSRYKLLDNLRRSLVPISLVAAFAISWIYAEGNPRPLNALLLTMFFFPLFITVWEQLKPRFSADSRMVLSRTVFEIWRELARCLAQLTLVPFSAYINLHAAVVATYRRVYSRRGLLTWESMGAAERRLGANFKSFWQVMQPSWLLTAVLAFLVVAFGGHLLSALPLLLLWLSAPWMAWFISRERRPSTTKLSGAELRFMGEVAYRTWQYFDRHLLESYHYLIPDNLQVVPQGRIAERTSPTNIGLSLLSVVSAYDLGFVGVGEAVNRVDLITSSLMKLERFRGHFLNWYDIRTLQPLAPRYVSTVDSGNLIGNLMALEGFSRRVPFEPLVSRAFVGAMEQLIGGNAGAAGDLGSLWQFVRQHRSSIAADAARYPDGVRGTFEHLALLLGWLDYLPMLRALGERGILPAKVRRIEKVLDTRTPTLSLVAKITDRLIKRLDEIEDPDGDLVSFLRAARAAHDEVIRLLACAEAVTERAVALVAQADFSFLYNHAKNFFVIGYNLESGNPDRNCYDLLASEARLTSLIAVAKGEIPGKHWFMLGRPVTRTAGGSALLSWSGTMFEYLMPPLICIESNGTLLGNTNAAVVEAQRQYARVLGIPWGISESGYSGVDFERTYQYRAFGVPGLGLKRGLADDLVISPYSSAMAIEIAPRAVVKNLRRLRELGVYGDYGFYEAIDYSPQRLSAEESSHIVRSFLAHHQGMTLVAINNFFHQGVMRSRFHRHPLIQAADFLLHERFPTRIERTNPPYSQHIYSGLDEEEKGERSELHFTPHSVVPRVHLLSNGTYSVHIDDSGCGESFFRGDTALTRWRGDALRDRLGVFFYIRDRVSKRSWSAAYEPMRVEPEHYEARFDPDKAEFILRRFGISSKMEVVVSPEDAVEVRRLTLTNLGATRRVLEFTSYGEVVLTSRRADQAHPAFSKMAVESEFIADDDALIFHRRKRDPSEPDRYFAHTVMMQAVWEPIQFDSSRDSFIGRGQSLQSPRAMQRDGLGATQGVTLDPVFALRSAVEIEPASSVELHFINVYAQSREELLQLVRKYKERIALRRVFELAWSQSDVEIRHIQGSMRLVRSFYHLANGLLYQVEAWRGPREALEQNQLGQAQLWRFGISGDLPIVLVVLSDPEQLSLAREALFAHEFLHRKGLSFDLVLLNEFHGGYLQHFQEELDFVVRTSAASGRVDKPGGVFLRNALQLSLEERRLLLAYAKIVLRGTEGSLPEQLVLPDRVSRPIRRLERQPVSPPAGGSRLDFFNGIGGFVPGERGYRMLIGGTTQPPRPWSNVIANERFGTLITEGGSGFTWAVNSRENRLSGWSNDPVIDPPGEVIYIRDAQSGRFWSATPKPCGEELQYEVTHAPGVSTFAGSYAGLRHELTVTVAPDEPVKWWLLALTNSAEEARRYQIVLYFEWVLAVTREQSQAHLRSRFERSAELLLVENPAGMELPRQALALGCSEKLAGYTADRREFLGRYGDVASPKYLSRLAAPRVLGQILRGGIRRDVLLQQVGAGLDSAGVLEVDVELAPGERRELSFFAAHGENVERAIERGKRVRAIRAAQSSVRASSQRWNGLCDRINVRTPDPAFDTLVNGWLLYQTLSGRMLGRTGFYQSSGAFGFRDQLQDSLAFLQVDPSVPRSQILLHAARQFPEGDVQHWWHPPSGRGVRTKIRDNYLWLPYAVSEYLKFTGDTKILDEQAGFLEGPAPDEHQSDLHYVPVQSSRSASIYEHCVLSIERAALSARGLPLIGHGDWNDGLNRVGEDGRGESVWLGWFLAEVLRRFADVAEQRGERERAEKWRSRSSEVVAAVEQHAWDGDWYRRAFFDDGTPLGSVANTECKIDAIAQSWAVITGLGDTARATHAFRSLLEKLVDHQFGLLLLLAPPFNTMQPNPGYIQGYSPGLRENGGQYTHAAAWTVIAAAKLRMGNEAHRLFSYLNPILKGSTPEQVARYRNEPYVLSGDVYGGDQLRGCGGWSWYTGSSGWLYRAAVEHILGVTVNNGMLVVDPVIPAAWPGFSCTLRLGGIEAEIEVQNPRGAEQGVTRIVCNGSERPTGPIPVREGVPLKIAVTIG